MRYALENRMYGFAGYSLNYGYNVVEHYQLPFTYRNMLDFGMGIKLTSLMSMYVTGKYLSRWGPAPAYFLLNAALDWSLFKTMPLKFEVRVENLLNQDIYEPEIARHSSQVPVIPKIQGRIFWLSFMYNFYR
jgi:outer membrane receptor protein involved in Fe transport